MIMAVDPLLEPANGPNYFPFDDNIRYQFLVDNDQDARPDVVFRVRFRTEQRLPGVPVGLDRCRRRHPGAEQLAAAGRSGRRR